MTNISLDDLEHVTGGGMVCNVAGQRAGEEAAKHYPPAQRAQVSAAYANSVTATCNALQAKGVSPQLF